MATARLEATFDAEMDPLLVALIDEELAKLPEKYRFPVILCDMNGKTRVETATELGWPEGTVATRLSQGRERLASQLRRRGIVLPSAGLAAVLSTQATAHVPASLNLPAVKILMGSSVVPSSVLPLAHSAGEFMSLKSLIFTTIGTFAVVGAIVIGWRIGQQKPTKNSAVTRESFFPLGV